MPQKKQPLTVACIISQLKSARKLAAKQIINSRKNNKPPDLLTGLLMQIESYAGCVDDVIAGDSLTPDEKETLRRWRDALRSSVNEILDIFDMHAALQITAPGDWRRSFNGNGIGLLAEALSAVFVIGSRTIKNPIMARLEQLAMKSRTAGATGVRLAQSKRKDDIIEKMIKPILEQYPKWTPNRIAVEILPSLTRAFQDHGLPSLGETAVRKRIAKLSRTNVRSSN
jgi:hypothetical protein